VATTPTTAVAVTTDAATPPGTYMVEVATDSYPGHVKSTEITVTVAGPAVGPTYTLINTAVNIASPGATGTSMITITPSGGFTGTVALSCTVTAIDPPTCAVPTPVAITGAGAVTATLTVYTTGVTGSAPTGYVAKAGKPLQRLFAIGGGVVMSALFFFPVPARRRRWKTFLSLLIFAFIGGAVLGCGGKANMAPANPGTTLGTYTVTVRRPRDVGAHSSETQ
jgi:hypothetical protein